MYSDYQGTQHASCMEASEWCQSNQQHPALPCILVMYNHHILTHTYVMILHFPARVILLWFARLVGKTNLKALESIILISATQTS